MRQYSIFQALWMSFYSKNFYKDVIKQWKGIAFIYLIIIVVIIVLPLSIELIRGMQEFKKQSPDIVKQIPEIRIVAGVVTTPQRIPYYIRAKNSNDIVAIIDTSGRYNSLNNTRALMLMTSNKIIIKKSEFEMREYSLASIQDITITNDNLNKWVHYIEVGVIAVGIPMIIIGLYIYKILAALLYSVIAIIVASIMKVNTTYSSKLSLSIVAMTPVSILIAVVEIFSLTIPFEWLLSVAITTGFIGFGLAAHKGTPDN